MLHLSLWDKHNADTSPIAFPSHITKCNTQQKCHTWQFEIIQTKKLVQLILFRCKNIMSEFSALDLVWILKFMCVAYSRLYLWSHHANHPSNTYFNFCLSSISLLDADVKNKLFYLTICYFMSKISLCWMLIH